MRSVHTAALGRRVILREEGSDSQVWADTFTGLYHLPPDDMPAPRTVLDLGANIGLTAAHYRALWPQAEIVAVEMDPDCCELARRNAPAVKIKQCAVSGAGGHGSYDPSLRAEAFRFRAGDDTGSSVQSQRLRQLILRSFPGHSADFVKMDVEGEEWNIFAVPEWAPLVKHLLVELHPTDDMPDDSDALVDLAREALDLQGFQTRRHNPHPRAVYAWRGT